MKNLYLFVASALIASAGANAEVTYDFVPTGGSVVAGNMLSPDQGGYTLRLDVPSKPSINFGYDFEGIKLRSLEGAVEGFTVDCGVTLSDDENVLLISIGSVELSEFGEYGLYVPADLFGNDAWNTSEFTDGSANPYFKVNFTTDDVLSVVSKLESGFNPRVTISTSNFNMEDVPEITLNWGGAIAYCDDDPFYYPMDFGHAITCDGQDVPGAGVYYGYYNSWVDIKAMITGLPVRDNKNYVFTIPEGMFYDADYIRSGGAIGSYSDEIKVEFNTFDLYAKDLELDFVPSSVLFEVTTVIFKEYIDEENVNEIPVDGLLMTLTYDEQPFSTPAYDIEGLKAIGFGVYDKDGAAVDCPVQFVYREEDDNNVLNIFFHDLTFDPSAGGYSVRLPFNTIGTMGWWRSWAKSGHSNPDGEYAIDLSGVERVSCDNNGVEAVYNLNGVRMDGDSLAPGIYVRVANGKATKVLVK